MAGAWAGFGNVQNLISVHRVHRTFLTKGLMGDGVRYKRFMFPGCAEAVKCLICFILTFNRASSVEWESSLIES